MFSPVLASSDRFAPPRLLMPITAMLSLSAGFATRANIGAVSADAGRKCRRVTREDIRLAPSVGGTGASLAETASEKAKKTRRGLGVPPAGGRGRALFLGDGRWAMGEPGRTWANLGEPGRTWANL